MSPPELEPVETIQTDREKLRAGEILLLAGSVLSMILACILWSAHKQGWMDEIFTWKEATDPSLGISTGRFSTERTGDSPSSTPLSGFG